MSYNKNSFINIGPKNEPKTVNFGYAPFCLNTKFLNIIQTLSLSYKRLPLVKMSTKLSHIWERKCPKTLPEKYHFMDTALPQKYLKNYNLTVTKTALIRLTAIMQLHKAFNLAENWGLTHQV